MAIALFYYALSIFPLSILRPVAWARETGLQGCGLDRALGRGSRGAQGLAVITVVSDMLGVTIGNLLRIGGQVNIEGFRTVQ